MEKNDLLSYKKFISSLSDEEIKERKHYLRNLSNGEIFGPMTGYASIDKPWLKYYRDDIIDVDLLKKSIYQAIKDNNSGRLNKIALELRSSANDFNKGISITYKKYLKRIEDVAKSYKALGLKVNDVVVTVLPNIPESRIIIYGLNILGVTVYPVSPMISSEQFKEIVSQNGVKNIVLFGGFYDKFNSVLDDLKLDSILYVSGTESLPTLLQKINKLKNKTPKITRDNLLTWDEFDNLKRKVKEDIVPYYDKDHVAIVVGTSGTTGIPKGVCLTDDNLNAIALQHKLSDIFNDEDVMLDALIQSIGYGISTMHYSTSYGYKNILIPELLFGKISDVICKTKPEHFTGGPVHMEYIMNSPEYKEGLLPPMRNLVSGGATLSKEIEKKLNNVSEGFKENGTKDSRILVRQGFGSTENGGCGAYAREGSYKFGGVGIPLPLDDISIFEPGTENELPYNCEGEICISGPTVMKEYLNNPKETNIVLKKHSDGKVWLHLADLGRIDEDGHLFITDRIKDIFMRTGFNVHPSKIEEYIRSISFVKDACVVGIEHTNEQMVPIAVIVLSDLATENKNMALEYIKESCYNNLEETSIPYDFVIFDNLTRNLGGKVDKNIIKNALAEYYKLNNNDKIKKLKF